MKKMRNGRRGFTLLEIVIVVAIIVILSAGAFLGVAATVNRASEAQEQLAVNNGENFEAYARNQVDSYGKDMVYWDPIPNYTPENQAKKMKEQMLAEGWTDGEITFEYHEDGWHIVAEWDPTIPEHRGFQTPEDYKLWLSNYNNYIALGYTKEEIERFLGCIEDKEDRLMFELFAYLGCRIGEFLGLTWDCLGDGYLEIKQQCGHEGRGKWILTPVLKTKESYRKCPLPPRLYEELSKRRISGSGRFFLFSLKKNHRAPYGETSFRNKISEYALKAELPILTPHCFRHSKATMLLEVCKNMEEVKSAARFLGHSATMLLDTYGHAKEETMMDILSRLG